MTDHASLRAALAGGAEFDDMTIITVRMGDLRTLLADLDEADRALILFGKVNRKLMDELLKSEKRK